MEPRDGLPPAVAGGERARLRAPAGRRPRRRQACERPARRGRKRLPLRLRNRRPFGRFREGGRPGYVVPGVPPAREAGRSSAHVSVGRLRARPADVRAARRSAAADGRGAAVLARDPARAGACARRSRDMRHRVGYERALRVGPRIRRGVRRRGWGAGGRDVHARGEPVQGLRGVRRGGCGRLLRTRCARRRARTGGRRTAPGRRRRPVRNRKVVGRQGGTRPRAPRRRAPWVQDAGSSPTCSRARIRTRSSPRRSCGSQ